MRGGGKASAEVVLGWREINVFDSVTEESRLKYMGLSRDFRVVILDVLCAEVMLDTEGWDSSQHRWLPSGQA